MDVIRTYVKEQLPAYLRSLPIPATVAGFAQLSGEDWLRLAPLLLLSGSLVALVVLQFVEPRRARPAINTIRPGPKHVDKVPLKEVENSKSDNVSFCRCWQSKKFRKWTHDTGRGNGERKRWKMVGWARWWR